VSLRLEKSLRDSLSQLPGADLDTIINAGITKLERQDYITRQDYISHKGIFGRVLVTVIFSAVIALGICVWLMRGHSVTTMVTLDVNAGFVLTANSYGEVLKVKGMDEAALNILRNVDYAGAGVKEVTGVLVSMSARDKYLTDNSRYILISVWDKDQSNINELLTDISVEANNAAKAEQIDPEVLGQNLELGGSLEQDAERLGITAGRLQLIDILLKYKPSYTLGQLTTYNIENLLKIAQAANISLPVSGYRTIDATQFSEQKTAGGW